MMANTIKKGTGFSSSSALYMVKASQPDLPVIIVSGSIGEDIAVASMKAGAQDYLLKPFSFDTAIEVVNRVTTSPPAQIFDRDVRPVSSSASTERREPVVGSIGARLASRPSGSPEVHLR